MAIKKQETRSTNLNLTAATFLQGPIASAYMPEALSAGAGPGGPVTNSIIVCK